MRDSIYRITLDMHDIASQVQIAVKQYDTARSLYITLMENGKPFQISEGCRAILSIASPESTVIVDDCEIRIKDSVIIYEFNNLTARYLGINECELKLYDLENDLLTSPKFTILVNENIFNDGCEHGIDHNLTLNRDKNDQHPISSITGLEEALESKTDDHDHELLSLRVDNIESIISDKWDSTVTYAVDAYVIYDNALWKCKSQNSAQIPAEGDYWTKCSVSSEITGLSSDVAWLSSDVAGLSSDVTKLNSQMEGKAPKNHAVSNANTYGMGGELVYGHLKITDNANNGYNAAAGIALSSAGGKRIESKLGNVKGLYANSMTANGTGGTALKLFTYSDLNSIFGHNHTNESACVYYGVYVQNGDASSNGVHITGVNYMDGAYYAVSEGAITGPIRVNYLCVDMTP